MLYKLSDTGPGLGTLEPLPFLNVDDLQKREKDLENLLADHLLEVLCEDEPLMPIFQERQLQAEADIYALNTAGDLVMALLRNSRSRRTGPRSSSASVHALRSWHSKLRHPVQHSALDRGFDFLVLDRAGREAYPEYRLVP